MILPPPHGAVSALAGIPIGLNRPISPQQAVQQNIMENECFQTMLMQTDHGEKGGGGNKALLNSIGIPLYTGTVSMQGKTVPCVSCKKTL